MSDEIQKAFTHYCRVSLSVPDEVVEAVLVFAEIFADADIAGGIFSSSMENLSRARGAVMIFACGSSRFRYSIVEEENV